MTEAQTLYSFTAPLLDGRVVTLDEFRGQVLLIVNTASRCGFTPQYAGLEKLHRAYADRGFAVLGFPSNQFGRQEPGSAAEIAEFCELNFRVTFPLFAKIEVNGSGAHPLYQYLKKQQPGAFRFLKRGRIPWNFTKFLVARSGEVVGRFGPRTTPEQIAPEIERLLSAAQR